MTKQKVSICHEASQNLKEPILDLFQMLFINLFSLQKKTFISYYISHQKKNGFTNTPDSPFDAW